MRVGWSYWDLFGGDQLNGMVLIDQAAVTVTLPHWPEDLRSNSASGSMQPTGPPSLEPAKTGRFGRQGSATLATMWTAQIGARNREWVIEQSMLMDPEAAGALGFDHGVQDWRTLALVLARPCTEGAQMDLSTTTALVTGANRGLGRLYVDKLVTQGAKVYAAARKPENIEPRPGVTPLRLDITDPDDVAAAADLATDVTLLVNNAGVLTESSLLTGDIVDIHNDLDTNFFGTLAMIRAFAVVIEGNGGGTILNMLSMFSWLSDPNVGAYCVSKAALWSLTNSLRLELAPRQVRVVGLHVGFVDTDMVRQWDLPKVTPESVVEAALAGLSADEYEIVADEMSRNIKQGLGQDVRVLYPALPDPRPTRDR
jgi:NAD(P)-dependent dehydrogenase (short-subunit alcohol dehydrogenase family)